MLEKAREETHAWNNKFWTYHNNKFFEVSLLYFVCKKASLLYGNLKFLSFFTILVREILDTFRSKISEL